ncbi:hypothetical protein [Halorarum salinum]|uniref:Uncharacterized protein n=1 Tax=Halorarum salinum TaxID=2743089 RepID=A0A7D5L8N9_9EURY|nr:hypothetical protein [Halobaculum salinum]QLG60269.1 hypothetical protein HUG12_00200 [Halobaculum salinum]
MLEEVGQVVTVRVGVERIGRDVLLDSGHQRLAVEVLLAVGDPVPGLRAVRPRRVTVRESRVRARRPHLVGVGQCVAVGVGVGGNGSVRLLVEVDQCLVVRIFPGVRHSVAVRVRRRRVDGVVGVLKRIPQPVVVRVGIERVRRDVRLQRGLERVVVEVLCAVGHPVSRLVRARPVRVAVRDRRDRRRRVDLVPVAEAIAVSVRDVRVCAVLLLADVGEPIGFDVVLPVRHAVTVGVGGERVEVPVPEFEPVGQLVVVRIGIERVGAGAVLDGRRNPVVVEVLGPVDDSIVGLRFVRLRRVAVGVERRRADDRPLVGVGQAVRVEQQRVGSGRWGWRGVTTVAVGSTGAVAVSGVAVAVSSVTVSSVPLVRTSLTHTQSLVPVGRADGDLVDRFRQRERRVERPRRERTGPPLQLDRLLGPVREPDGHRPQLERPDVAYGPVQPVGDRVDVSRVLPRPDSHARRDRLVHDVECGLGVQPRAAIVLEAGDRVVAAERQRVSRLREVPLDGRLVVRDVRVRSEFLVCRLCVGERGPRESLVRIRDPVCDRRRVALRTGDDPLVGGKHRVGDAGRPDVDRERSVECGQEVGLPIGRPVQRRVLQVVDGGLAKCERVG